MYKRAILFAVGIVAFLVVFASFISATLLTLLLLFLCILFAIGMRGMADWLADHTSLSRGLALALVGIGLLTLGIGMGLLIGPHLAEQFVQLRATIPESLSA